MSDLAGHCVELLSPLGAARARRMFGGHGLYVDDLFIAVIVDDQVYLKVDVQTQPRFEAAGCVRWTYLKPPRSPHRGDRPPEGARRGSGRPSASSGKDTPVAMSYWSVPAEAMESPQLMQPWARLAIEAALRARASKPAAKPRKARAASPKAAATRARKKA